jgi:hypothetical protein
MAFMRDLMLKVQSMIRGNINHFLLMLILRKSEMKTQNNNKKKLAV